MVLSRAWKSIFNGYFLMGNEFHTETRYGMCRTSSEVPRATLQRARSAKFPAQLATSAKREVPRAGFASVSYLKAHRKRRALCPHKGIAVGFCGTSVYFYKKPRNL